MRPLYSDLTELLLDKAASSPDQVAFTFLRDGEKDEVNWTYAELEQRARAVAVELQSAHCFGQRVLLLYPSGLDFIAAFWGCVLAGAVAVPAYPPRSNRTLFRLQAIANDCQAAAVLTTRQILSRMQLNSGNGSPFATLRCLVTDDLPLNTAEEWQRKHPGADSIALLQYTSGSTSTPKGVMVSHANLLHNEALIQRAFRQSKESIIVGWLPLYHDMGLIGNALQPIYSGARCILMSPVSFLQSPVRWLRAISHYKATTSGGPNFSYDLCTRKITPQDEEGLDLSSWTVAFNGAEPVRAETLKKFAERFVRLGFKREALVPCYGLAEATLLVSGLRDSRPAKTLKVDAGALAGHRIRRRVAKNGTARTLVSSGRAADGIRLRIVDPESGLRCPAHQVGEIWVEGASVAQGYWGQAEESERIFNARIAKSRGGRFLRTGDLGFIQDGELFVTGRLKDLIIVRGRNLYPQDIEATVERAHPGLRAGCVAAFSMDAEPEERVVIVQEVERGYEHKTAGMADAVRCAVVEQHEIQPHVILLTRAGTIPKTSSGKIQRYMCREQFVAGTLDPIAQWHGGVASDAAVSFTRAATPAALEQWLVRKFASGTNVAADEIDVNRPVAHYTLDSLAAVELVHAIEREWGITAPVSVLLKDISIRELTLELLKSSPSSAVGIAREEFPEADTSSRSGDFALSEGQKALWFLYQLDPQNTAYNLSFAARITSGIKAPVLQRAFQTLADRHEALRMTFHSVEGVPLQRLHDSVELPFREFDATEWDAASLQDHIQQEADFHFNLEQGPLLRVTLFQCKSEHVICLTTHHIIADLWSLSLLMRELTSLYVAGGQGQAQSLPVSAYEYRDYVKWQRTMLAGPEGESLRSYWKDELAGELPVLNLPADHPRPAIQTYRGTSKFFKLGPELSQAIGNFSTSNGATVYTTLLAAFQALLYRYSGQEDILVGSPAAARNRAEWANVFGYFVNPLVLRARINDRLTFAGLLLNTRQTVLDALEHQDYPFFNLVEQLQPVRDLSRSPLFQAMFVFEKTPQEEGISAFALGEAGVRAEVNGVALESVAIRNKASQFDLQFTMVEAGKQLCGSILYNPDLFEAETIQRMADHWETLLCGIISHPGTAVCELPLLTTAERRQLLQEWNETETHWEQWKAVHQLFEEQVARTPGAMATSYAGSELTYAELNARANQLAHYLRKLGVGPESQVGVCMERSLELVTGLVATLKAGAAYVPLDPDYPAERLASMIEDMQPAAILVHEGTATKLPRVDSKIVNIDADWQQFERESDRNLGVQVIPQNLAYVIYTSGSTGRPKGAMNSHGGLHNRLQWMQSAYKLGSNDRVLQKTPFSFDVSVWEFFWPLMTGAGLVVAEPGGHQDPAYLGKLIEQRRITTLHFVPSMLRAFLESGEAPRCGSVRRVICSGEALGSDVARLCLERMPADLYNLYGPTEASIDVTSWKCEAGNITKGVPIGRPIANMQVYVLSESMEPVPAGVPGELYLGGMGLARGYWRRPDLTAEKFVPNSWGAAAGERLYRTGDLVKWRADGNLEFLQRIDHQVKIRGNRIELGEIETVMNSHDSIGQAVVIARDDQRGEKHLVAYVTPKPEAEVPSLNELRLYLRQRVPEYMVPSVIAVLEQMPLSPNGKVDRKALPEISFGSERETYIRPATPEEEILCGIWSDVLGVERIGRSENFFELGGHSLKAMQVLARMRTSLGVELPVRAIFEAPTVAALAELVVNTSRVEADFIKPIDRATGGQLPLSYAQQRLWFIHQMEPQQISYNLPGAARIRGPLNLAALEKAFREITRRHESLRTGFVSVNGEPRQFVDPEVRLELPLIDLTVYTPAESSEKLEELEWLESRTPFDLEHAPLLRMKAVRLSADEHLLLVTMHHIISDGWSFKILLRELKTLYEAYIIGKDASLPELKIQYGDYAVWQRKWLDSSRLEEQISYWTTQLANAPRALDLPTDHPRPVVQSNRGTQQRIQLAKELLDQLRKVCRQQSVTLYMTLLAALQSVFYRYTGQQDIVIGSPIAGRRRTETEGLIGFFVNTLAMRTKISGELTFTQLLQKVKKTTLDAYAHQDVPFEKLIETLSPERDIGRTPLFQVIYGLQDESLPETQLGEANVQMFQLDNGAAKFDLTLMLEESETGIQGLLEYSSDLFEPATITRLIAHFRNLLDSAALNPEQTISTLSMLGEAERHQLVVEWNQTTIAFPQKCVHELLDEQAVCTPDAAAIIFEDRKLTYAELNQQSNQIGRYLRKLGVGREVKVGICVERSLEAVAGLAGILKAGGAFVPLDPEYPAERLRYMIADLDVQVLVTHKDLGDRFPDFSGRIVCLDADWSTIAKEDPTTFAPACVPENLAYVMYTSGSTGLPKGVGVQHASIVRLVRNTKYIDFSQARKFLQFAPISFDASTFEIWGALLNGAQLVIFPPGLPSLSDLGQFIQANAIDTMFLTTSLFHQMMETEDSTLKGVKQLITGGEIVSPQIAARGITPGNVLLNAYGPTENTTFSTSHPMSTLEDVGEGPLSIGVPIANSQVYVLDAEMQPVPAGVAGELFTGGAGLARGYINRPDVTAEKFVPNPFSEMPGQRLYRTGDLVRWRADGKLDFIGRADRQIKIRGFRVELGEIEEALLQHAGVEDATVLTIEQDGTGKRLVAYVATGREAAVTSEELLDDLRQRLPDYMVPGGWVLMEQLPTTTNGKIDRDALKALEPELSWNRDRGKDEAVPVRTPVEEIVCGIWEQVLKIHRVGVNDSFFDLGGHSLLATQIVSRVEQIFSVHLPLRTLFEGPTIREMARAIEQVLGKETEVQAPPIRCTDRQQPLPLSYAQQRLWFIDQLEQGSASYNVSGGLHFAGPVNIDALDRAFQEIVRRHESLRTRFEVVRGEPRQIIEKEVRVALPIVDLTSVAAAHQEVTARKTVRSEIEQAFDLRQAPLLRVKLLRIAPEEHLLVVTMHHIVCDGWSLGILTREFGELYEAYCAGEESPLPDLVLQYGDFAVWQREWLQGEVLERQMSFWKKQLSGAPPLELPRDYPRPPIMSHRGGSLEYGFSAELTAKLQQVSRREGASLFMVLLSGFNVLLASYSGIEDVSVGTPIANRNRVEIESLIGDFVNSLVLRTDVSRNPTWREMLRRTRKVTLEAYQHQDIPFEKLVEELQPERDLSRSPFFQNLLVLQNTEFHELHLHGLTVQEAHPDRWIAKYDLIVDLTETQSGLKGYIDYALDLFEEQTVRNFGRHLEIVLEALVADLEQPISNLSLLAGPERTQVVAEWNQTDVSIPQLCVHELFDLEADRTPGAIALETDGRELTYGELNRKANQLAHYLRGLGVVPETRVAICMERGLDMIVGLLGILKAGGAYVPLDPAYPIERLSHMLENSQAPVLLTQKSQVDKLPSSWAYMVSIDEDWPQIERESTESPGVVVSPRNLAYVIYTSGSTGIPKGVEVEHRSIVRLVKQSNYVELRPEDRFLQFAPVSFDASTFEIWACLLNGAQLVVFPPGTPSIGELVQVIEQKKITIMWLTAGLFHQVIDLEGSRLGSVRQLLAGGDVLSTVHVRKALELAPQMRLINGYGPTENTTFSCCYGMRKDGGHRIADSVPIGQPITNTRAYVLDANFEPVPAGILGELYVGGIGLARGYANRPDLTAEKFIPDPLNGSVGGRLYRTGDVVRWRRDGTLEFAGRRDNQVKVRGYRIEPAEIERALLECADVQQAVVIARGDHAEDKRLVAYVVPPSGRSAEAGKLADHLRRTLPAYMIPSHFVELNELPLTANGKVDRNALPAPIVETEDTYVAPQTAQEEVLCGIVAEVLEQPRVGMDDNFFDLGGHSLLATLIVSRVRAIFGVDLPLQTLFESPTVRGMSERLTEELAAAEQSRSLVAIPRLERDGSPLPLSYAQQRLWFIDQLEPGSALYNIPLAGKISGALAKEALQRSLDEIVRRHEVLRTRFAVCDGVPVQEIVPDEQITIEHIDLRGLSEAEREAEAMALAEAETAIGFDLANGPLIRMKLLQMAEAEHVLLMTIHHIISDGWSFKNFFSEIGRLYDAYLRGEGSPLKELEIQYADFAGWQRQWLQGKNLEEQLAYWRQQLEGLQVLDLPTDHPRPAMPRHRGATIRFEMASELTSALKELGARHEATLFMLLLAAFDVLLFRYSGQEDIAVGSPIANRNRKEIENLIGFFVNTLVLRANLAGRPSFVELLDQIKKTTLDAYANQDLPFEKLVEVLSPERDISRTPLFQVVFAMQSAPLAEVPLGDLKLQLFNVNSSTAKFDLILGVVEDEGSLKASLEYNIDLFEPESARLMVEHYQALLASIVAEPERPIQTLPFLTEIELRQLTEWNRTDSDWPQDKCLADLFEEQVQRIPHMIAVECEGQQLTYEQLDRRSNQLGRYLQKLGVGPEVRVGICLERSLDLIASLMAVQKAGGAYVPLDPAYPAERVSYMLEDSQASVLLTQNSLRHQMPPFTGTVVNLDDHVEEIAQESAARPERHSLPENLAYVIYTSGSTGRPKGVAIRHRSVVAFIYWCRETFSAVELAGVLASTSICFDVSIFETFVPLSCGGTLILVGSVLDVERIHNPERLTIISTVPSAMRELVAMKAIPDSVRTVNLGGEAVPVGLASQIYENTKVERVLNMYGPTEDTTYSTCALLPRETERTVPIGRPISNSKVYVLDAEMQQVPVGVAGDIYISGAGLARGYLTHPEWTAEKFIPNPFSDTPGERLYRVGDLGSYRTDGQVGYLGRNDFQVKIRGHRIELGEIEAALEEIDEIAQAVVMARDDGQEAKQLVAYLVMSSEMNTDEIRERLRRRLPEYMSPSAFVKMESLPLTPNGKINRRALPAPAMSLNAVDGSYAAPSSPLEELLADIWAQVLGLEKIGVNDDFFARGGHSLLATQVVARMRSALNVNIPLTRIFETPTIAALARFIEQQLQGTVEKPTAISRIPHEEPVVLSYTQKRLWFIAQLEPDGISYNLPAAVQIEGTLDVPVLEKSLKEIVRRHEALRTRFVLINGEPRQLIDDTATLDLRLVTLEDVAANERDAQMSYLIQQDARKPFDLEHGPLVRVTLLRLGKERHVLVVTMHHIVADDWSMGILVKELTVLYRAFAAGRPSPLAELPIQYADFSMWQQKAMGGEALAQQLEYWKTQLSGMQTLVVPTDRSRPAAQSGNGARVNFSVSAELTGQLRDFGRRHNATLYMTLLMAYQTLLFHYSGQSDIPVGTSIAGRRHEEIEGLIGCFINMLVLRTDLSGEPTFVELLKRVKDVTLGAYANQDLPFEKLVETLQPERGQSRSPLFQVMLVFHNTPQSELQLGSARLQTLDIEHTSTKFDLTLFVSEDDGGLKCVLYYSTDLFDSGTIARLVKDFETILNVVAFSPEMSIAAVSLTSEDEQRQLLSGWNEADDLQEKDLPSVATAGD